MKYKEALIAWTPNFEGVFDDRPTKGQVKVGRLLHRSEDGSIESDWTKPYAFSGGAAYHHIRTARKWVREMLLFIEFNTLVVRDLIPPEVVHKAFLEIDEYRQRISPDIKGAEGGGLW